MWNSRSIVVAEFGGLVCGLVCGVVAAALAVLPSGMDPSRVIASCTLGMMVATPAAGYFADAFGRRRTLSLAALLLLLSVPLIAGCEDAQGPVLAGRFLQGAGAGILFAVLPMYVAEILPDDCRGRGVSLLQLFILIGQVLGAFLGFAMTRLFGSEPWLWRVVFAVPAVPAVLFGLGTLVMEETSAGCAARKRGWHVRLLAELVLPENRKVVSLMILVLAFSSALASGPIMNLSVRMLHDVGGSGLWANRMDVLLQACSLVATLAAVAMADRLGSRRMLALGVVGTVVGFGGLAAAFGVGSGLGASVALAVFAVSYCFGPGVCVFLVMNELLPDRIRATGIAVALRAYHAVSASVAMAFMPCVSAFGYCRVFFALLAVSVAFLLLVLLGLPRRRRP